MADTTGAGQTPGQDAATPGSEFFAPLSGLTSNVSGMYQGQVHRPDIRVRFSWVDKGKGPVVSEVKNIISIQTHKMLADPAGTWQIVLNHAPIADNDQRTWENVLKPNDYVEIYFGHAPEYPSPVRVVRGFIDNVRMIDGIQNNRVTRRIVIDGRDFGKVWSIVQMLNVFPPTPISGLVAVQAIYDAYQLGYETGTLTLQDFFGRVINNVLKPYTDYKRQSVPILPDIIPDATEIDPILKLWQYDYNTLQGAMYNLLKVNIDEPWMELFVADEDDVTTDAEAPVKFTLRWARNRYADASIWTPLQQPLTVKPFKRVHRLLDPTDINFGINDTEVVNFFFTMDYTNQATDAPAGSIGPNNPYIIGPSIDAYGLRPLQPVTKFLVATGADQPTLQQQGKTILDIDDAFNLWLALSQGHMYLLGNGTAVIRGRPDIVVGDEVLDTYYNQIYYVTGVGHSWTFGAPYTTTLTLTRGMPLSGFGDPRTIDPFAAPSTLPDGLRTYWNNLISEQATAAQTLGIGNGNTAANNANQSVPQPRG